MTSTHGNAIPTARARADDDVAAFYARSYPPLVAVLVRVAGSRREAEDLAQEAFSRLLPRWDKVSRYDDPEAWVRQVAFRLAVSRWRRARTATASLLRSSPPLPVEPPGEDRLEVDRILRGLSKSHRQVLVMHYGLDLPVEQIARDLGISPGTVIRDADVIDADAEGAFDKTDAQMTNDVDPGEQASMRETAPGLVNLRLSPEAKARFRAYTDEMDGKNVAFLLNGVVVGAPTINGPFDSSPQLSFDTLPEARDVAKALHKR